MERIETQFTSLAEIYPLSSRRYYEMEVVTETLVITQDEISLPINHVVTTVYVTPPAVPNNIVWYHDVEICRGRRLPEEQAIALLVQAIETEEYMCFINEVEVTMDTRRAQYTQLWEHNDWAQYITLDTENIYDDELYTVTTRDIEPSAEEIAQFLANPSSSYLYAQKLVGVEFEGVMCSATKEDMWGLSSVEPLVLSGTPVNFKFDNGEVLVLTADNVAAFQAVWVPFRMSFF